MREYLLHILQLICAMYMFRRSPYARWLGEHSHFADDLINCNMCSMFWLVVVFPVKHPDNFQERILTASWVSVLVYLVISGLHNENT